jgi:hypothetical protein
MKRRNKRLFMKQDTKHYTLQEWVDFARGVLSPELRSAMQRHLDSPCKECQDPVAFWQAVLARASREVEWQPPDEAVRQVKAVFGFIKPSERRPGPLGLAERIFDSALQPAPGRLCSASATVRQMVYQSRDCLLDLCLQTGKRGVSLVGQLLKAGDPAEAYGRARVRLWGAAVLAEATSNEFGEFLLGAGAGAAAWVLVVEVAGRPTVLARLPRSAEG